MPRKPPAGTNCDAHTGTGYDRVGKPVVYRCDRIATETVIVPGFPFEMWLCSDHASTVKKSEAA